MVRSSKDRGISIEPLEGRKLLSASIQVMWTYSDAQVIGTSDNDQIKAVVNDVVAGIEMTVNGKTYLLPATVTVITVQGMAGDDRIRLEGNSLTLHYVFGDNPIKPEVSGRDQIHFRNPDAPVYIDAGPGGDLVNTEGSGMSGDVQIELGGGNDVAVDGKRNAFINGGAGNDNIFGQHGNDLLNGGPGHDLLSGGDGDDILVAELPEGVNDRYRGSLGTDTVIVNDVDDPNKLDFLDIKDVEELYFSFASAE